MPTLGPVNLLTEKIHKQKIAVHLVHFMKELSSVMPSEDLLNGFQTSHMMHDCQLFEINLCSLNVSKGHKTSLQLARIRLMNSKIEENKIAECKCHTT